MIAFIGYEGLKEAGAKCEELVPDGSRKGKTGFTDLFLPPESLASVLTDN